MIGSKRAGADLVVIMQAMDRCCYFKTSYILQTEHLLEDYVSDDGSRKKMEEIIIDCWRSVLLGRIHLTARETDFS
jgi:hypothetical protein